MYPVGVGSSFYLLLHSLHPPWSFPYSLACPLISLVALLCLSLRVKRPSKPNTAPVTLPGLRIFSILPFFGQRHDFLSHGFRVTGQNVFQFNLLRVRCSFNTLLHARDTVTFPCALLIQRVSSSPSHVIRTRSWSSLERKAGEISSMPRDWTSRRASESSRVQCVFSPPRARISLKLTTQILTTRSCSPPQLPFVTGITSDLRQKRINQIYKRLGSAQHTERLENRTCALPRSINSV